jgi:hypothetical protein
MKMKQVQRLQVIEYGGRKLVRRVAADRCQSVVVCNEREYAMRSRRVVSRMELASLGDLYPRARAAGDERFGAPP